MSEMPTPNIILIGLRGSGKSTVGKLIADRLRRPFVDLDELTPRELGCSSIKDAWAKGGEAPFRQAESAVLDRVLMRDGQVIALGGGTPTAPGAAAALETHRTRTGARILYLHAAPGELHSRLRLADNSHRPPLTAGALDPLQEIEVIYGRRDAIYRRLADATVESGSKTAAQVVEELMVACMV